MYELRSISSKIVSSKSFIFVRYLFIILLTLVLTQSVSSQKQIPQLNKTGLVTQLIVDGKPYLILGGELGNSTATTTQNMKSVWPKLTAMNLNTILVSVYWELIEKNEGQFDFSLYKSLITEARSHHLKIVFLWFGVWKNSMSSHAPAWIKLDQQKYPRVKNKEGQSLEILSSFSEHVLKADVNAFSRLMSMLKSYDSIDHTVIMVQVENEIGMLSSARDYHALAEAAFKKQVPASLIEYLKTHQKELLPELIDILKSNDHPLPGNWEEVFGKGIATDEIFMAYFYSTFINQLAAAGKKIYPLPMYVNAALNKAGRVPGDYPSAGPLPHLFDIWKAGGSSIDFYSPDFYNPDFTYWCDLYTRRGNPLFIPEHAFDGTVAAKALYTFAQYEGIGYSPFSIESSFNESLSKMYRMIQSMQHIITAYQGKNKINGILLSKAKADTTIIMGKYELTCKHDYTLSWTAGSRTDDWPYGSAMIIQISEDEFYIAGTGVVITFKNKENKSMHVGLLKVDEGIFENKIWKTLRHLNGDQTHQGRHINIPTNQIAIQKVKLYEYE